MKLSLSKCWKGWQKNVKIPQLQLLCKFSKMYDRNISTISCIQIERLDYLRFYRYIKNHHLHKLNDDPNFDYLGHPVNAYHFIRHVASGWKKILNDGPKINKWIESNVGQIIWNNFLGDIGNTKISFTLGRQLVVFSSIKHNHENISLQYN